MIRHSVICMIHGGAFTCIHQILQSTLFTSASLQEGVVEKPDVVGAIFGQTEGLLGEDLDLRDLQRTGRVGRIDVQITSKKGETKGEILISTSLDRAETAILAASLETIDRVRTMHRACYRGIH